MSSFLLPCECGRKLEVTAAQAGQRMTCACGRAVDVPTLRGLQSLERTGDETAPTPRRWGARQGLLFLGTAIALVSLIAAVGLELTRPKGLIVVERLLPPLNHPGIPLQDSIEPMTNFQSLTPADVWLTWQITTPVGADPRASVYGSIADHSETHSVLSWRDWRFMVWIIGGIGIALITASLLIPARKVRPTARNRAGSTS
jgi:hypothetical protein